MPTLGRPTNGDRRRLVVLGGDHASQRRRDSTSSASGVVGAVVSLVALGASSSVARRRAARSPRPPSRGPAPRPPPRGALRSISGVGLGRQRPDDGVEQVARCPRPCWRADRVGLLPAQRVELRRVQLALLVVGLVGGHDDGRRRAPQQLGGLLVGGRQAGGRIDHEQDDVGLGDGQPRLVLDLVLDRVARVDARARRCRRPRTAGRSTRRRRTAGRAWCGRGPRRSRRRSPTIRLNSVRLADIGAADDGDDGQAGEGSGRRTGDSPRRIGGATAGGVARRQRRRSGRPGCCGRAERAAARARRRRRAA